MRAKVATLVLLVGFALSAAIGGQCVPCMMKSLVQATADAPDSHCSECSGACGETQATDDHDHSGLITATDSHDCSAPTDPTIQAHAQVVHDFGDMLFQEILVTPASVATETPPPSTDVPIASQALPAIATTVLLV